MSDQTIFLPMLATMALTVLVWLYMYARRIPAMYAAGKSVQAYTSPGAIEKHLPEDVNYSANNLKNLFEVPVLFYALCLYLFVTGNVDSAYMTAAWVFVIFRAAHSAVQCTRNIVKLRFYLYLGSCIALFFMVGRALFYAISA